MLALNDTGVVYVVGDNQATARLYGNGAAKSTLWDALTWCLYGRTPRGLRTTDVKPWAGGKPFVNVLLVADGVDYMVMRTTSPKNLFTVNDKECADISDVLPISFDLFVNTIVLPQERELFFDLQPKDKMKLITEARGLERWDTRSAAASTAVSAFEGEAGKFLNEKRTTEGALEEVERLLTNTRKLSQEWNDELLKRKQVSKMALDVLGKELERKARDLDTATLDEDSALTELRACEREVSRLEREAHKVLAEITVLQGETKTLLDRSKNWEADLTELARAKECPTCGQPVKATNLAEHRLHLKEQIADAARKIATKLKRRTIVVSEGEAIQTQLKRHLDDIPNFREKANAAGDVRTRLGPEVASLRKQVLAATAIKDEVNPHLDQVATLSKRRKGLLADLESIQKDVDATNVDMERAKYWVKAFKDIKLQLIEEVMQELELVANSMIEEVGLDNWQIKFETEKESKSGSIQQVINVQISSPESTGFVRWESWSGGECQRLKLIGSLALSDVLLAQVGIETNLEVLDEPAVYWSSEGVQELCAFLADRAREREKTLFYIEHQAVESSHFSEVIRVVKDNDGAYIGQKPTKIVASKGKK